MTHAHSHPGTIDVNGRPALVTLRHPLAMVYGGGGVFGIAYTAGVAAGLAAAGIQAATAPALGTSAGSWTASAIALGLTYDDFKALDSPSVPNLRTGVLADIARQLFGEARHPRVAVSAVCVRTGRRHILDGGRYPLADLVAASSAVPGLLAPHRVDGRLYVDGGMWSATSIDAAAEADHVVVVAPLAGAVLGPLGRTAGLLLEIELGRWKARHPECSVTLIRPNRAIARVVGIQPLALFDAARAREVYPLAHAQGLRHGELMNRPPVAPRPAA
jgi:NTE family protein